jgi:hypothetical protein
MARAVAEVCADPSITTCGSLCPEGSEIQVGDVNDRSCDQLCTDLSEGGVMSAFSGGPPREELKLGFNNMGGWDLAYSTTRIREWCNYCVHAITGDVDPSSQPGTLEANVDSMSLADWLSLAFAALVVSFQVVGELKDMQLCSILLSRTRPGALGKGWMFGLRALYFLRRWVFLTVLTVSVPLLVVFRGGDALNICFNTVAILFDAPPPQDPWPGARSIGRLRVGSLCRSVGRRDPRLRTERVPSAGL